MKNDKKYKLCKSNKIVDINLNLTAIEGNQLGSAHAGYKIILTAEIAVTYHHIKS